MYKFILHNGLFINKDLFEILKDNTLDDFKNLKDIKDINIFKQNKFRSVVRIKLKDRIFYLKLHFWPWKERLKSLIPFIKREDAKNEWKNMILLKSLGFNTMTPVAFGEKKFLGIPYFSLTLTENLYDAEKLEQFLPKHFSPPLNKEKILKKREIIKKIALIARDFHSNGLNHQDFYLGHLFIRPKDEKIFIIDIQRVHHRKKIRARDQIKDLAQLGYSAKRLGILNKTDLLRFFHFYIGDDKLTINNKKLIKRIMSKIEKIAKHDAKLQLRKNKLKANN